MVALLCCSFTLTRRGQRILFFADALQESFGERYLCLRVATFCLCQQVVSTHSGFIRPWLRNSSGIDYDGRRTDF